MKAQMGCRGVALPLNLAVEVVGGVVIVTSRLLYPWKETWDWMAGQAPGPGWKSAENFSPIWIQSLDPSACSESLYQHISAEELAPSI